MPLAPPKKNDSVFQLSLTELAFTLVFLLLLLAGWMVFDEARKAEDIAKELAAFKDERAQLEQAKLESKQLKEAADRALDEVKKTLLQTSANPEDVISDLRRCSEKQAENISLKQKIADLDSKITAMVAIKEMLDNAAGADRVKSEVEQALAFKSAYEAASKAKLAPEEIEKRAKSCADAQDRLSEVQKENQNLRGQLAFMTKQIASTKGPKGFGFPPCWVDESGRVQRLFSVRVTENGLVVRPGWLPEREDSAKSLPNISGALFDSKEQSINSFRMAAMPILEWSKKQDPECRHYASIEVSASSVAASVAGDNAVNDFFYPIGKKSVVK